MRTLFVVIVVCALGAPVASALPLVSNGAVGLAKSDATLMVAKRGQKSAKKNSEKNYGIRPLVGSGDY